MSSESAGLRAVHNLYDGFLRGDVAGALSTVAADVEWVEHFPYPGTFRGPAAVAAVFAKVGREFERYEMAFERFVEDGDMVLVLGRYTIVKRGAAEVFRSPFVHLYRVADGVVTRYEGLLDTAEAHRCFGALRFED